MRRLNGMTSGLLCLLAGAATAAAAEQASGRFESTYGWLDVHGAYAFPATVGIEDEPGIRVAISNAGFKPEGVDVYWDRQRAIDRYFQDEETLVVYLHFTKTGSLLGASWYWGTGAGCGFCSNSETTSTVRVADGRIGGRVALKDDDLTYDVTFDVPIAPATPGKDVPADGEAARAYLAYHAALDARDPEAAAPLVTEDLRGGIAEAKAKGENSTWTLAEDHPEKVKVVRAFELGDEAVLLVEGEASWGSLHGEVQMKREGGSWRFWGETFEAGGWPKGLAP